MSNMTQHDMTHSVSDYEIAEMGYKTFRQSDVCMHWPEHKKVGKEMSLITNNIRKVYGLKLSLLSQNVV
jgi:hypothetical protein